MRRKLTAGVLLGLGLGCSAWGSARLLGAFDTTRWPTAPGVVTASRLDVVHDASEQQSSYTAHIGYRYRVGAAVYNAARVGLLDHASSSHRMMNAIRARYPVGAQVTVYYDPENPRAALLEPGPPGLMFVPLGFGVLSIVLGVRGLRAR